MNYLRKSISLLVGLLIVFSLTITNWSVGKVKSYSRQIKILPILLDFSDEPHQRLSAEIYDFFFGSKPEDRSLRNYFFEVTNGDLEFIPGNYGVGDWVKMPKKKIEYAKAGSVSGVVQDYFDIVAKKNIDFSEYDQDRDGYIDYTIIVQSGDPSEGYGGSIFWLHYSPRAIGSTVSDSLSVGQYIMTAEKFRGNKIAPLQGICHEFYHFQGGYDLYSYQGSNNWAVGPWCNMAENTSFSILGLCGFSRAALNWLKPVIITKPGVYEIDALSSAGKNRLYRVNIPKTQEYFLIENRQAVGIDSWWQGIVSTGLIFTHVDGGIPYSHMFNDGPKVFPHYAVWVEDGGGVLQKKDAVFCADKFRTEFSPDTYPDTWDYDRKSSMGIYFTEISKSDLKMTFKVDFKYIEPHPDVEPKEIDFGKIQKGLEKRRTIRIFNIGTGTLNLKLSSKDAWLKFDPEKVTGNDEIVTVIANADYMNAGKYKGKIDIKFSGGSISVSAKVEIVDKLGDLNSDTSIDKEDIKIFLESFGLKIGEPNFNIECDFNEDNAINLLDFCILAKNMS